MTTNNEDAPFEFTEAQLIELAEFAGSGVSESSLAYIFGCPPDRFKELLTTNVDVERAVYASRARTSAKVAGALVRSAEEGDVRAQQFFLKNRDRTWSDRSQAEIDDDRNQMHPPKLVIALSQDDSDS